MEKQTITHQDLRQFTGDVTRYRHWMNRHVIYTPGIKHLYPAHLAMTHCEESRMVVLTASHFNVAMEEGQGWRGARWKLAKRNGN